MIATKHQVPTTAQIIEVLSQTIGNPIELKKSDFMMGLVTDQNGNVQENLKKMVIGGKYYFLAYDECASKTSDGLPDYSKLPLYVIPFQQVKFKDKNVDTIFTWTRAILNVFSTFTDAGFFAQDQSEAQVKAKLQLDKKEVTNPNMYLASYIKDGQVAFVMTLTEN